MRGRSEAFLQSIIRICCGKYLEKPASVEASERRTIMRERSAGRRSSNDNSRAPPIAKHG